MSRERWHADEAGRFVKDENGLLVAAVRVAEDLPLVTAAPRLREALQAFVDACGGNPPDFLRTEHDEAVDALLASYHLED